MKNPQSCDRAQEKKQQGSFTKLLRVPQYGFTVHDRKKTVSHNKAYEILRSTFHKGIVSAQWKEDCVELTRRVLTCSRCGKDTLVHLKPEDQKEPLRLLDNWFSQQTSLFENRTTALAFHVPEALPQSFVCPRCGAVLSLSKGEVEVILAVKKGRIKLSRKLEWGELAKLEWAPEEFSFAGSELYETITFNLKNGHTFVSLGNENGSTLLVRDISNRMIDVNSTDPIFELINSDKIVNRALKRQFQKILQRPLPFPGRMLFLYQFTLMARFSGHDTAFFRMLPYAESEIILDNPDRISRKLRKPEWFPNVLKKSQLPTKSETILDNRFYGISKKLRKPEWLSDVLKKSVLPQAKSIRKILFENPEFFFYLKELEQFWGIFQDVDVFRTFLLSNDAFLELSLLCKTPGILSFYREYIQIFGAGDLITKMKDRKLEFYSYAIQYCMLSPPDQLAERQKWPDYFIGDDSLPYTPKGMGSMFSVPFSFSTEIGVPQDCTIDGYSFIRLVTSAEYILADTSLVYYQTRSFHGDHKYIYGILKGGKLITKVTMERGDYSTFSPFQVETFTEKDIPEGSRLAKAYNLWKKRNHLEDDL